MTSYQGSPFGVGQLALKAVERSVQHLSLAFVQWLIG